MLKRKEFIAGAAVGLALAAAATAGGIIDWPQARAQEISPADALLVRINGQPVFSPPPGAPLSFADIVDAVSPAVVSIDVRQSVDVSQLRDIPGLEGLPFDIVPEGEEGEGQLDVPDQYGSGSGFFISADGYIVTNNHVVANAEEITVRLNDEREFTATLVGTDPESDLAVIRVEGSDFPFVRFETDARPRVGDWVLAIGNPLGLGGTVTAGVVSAYGRQIDQSSTPYVDYMQIDAPINRGNSGGPTFDIHGRVIGVNSAIYSPNGYSVGIGFAIPADVAQRITQQLISGGSVERGYVGIQILSIGEGIREALALDDDFRGAIVGGVNADGPADQGGLEVDDLVVAVNGEPIRDSADLTRRVGAVAVGETVQLEVLRGDRLDRRETVSIRAAVRPSAQEIARLNAANDNLPDFPEPGVVSGESLLGMTLAPVDDRVRQLYGIADDVEGVVITDIQPRTPAARIAAEAEAAGANFGIGTVISRADRRAIDNADDLRRILEDLRNEGRLRVLLAFLTAGQSSLMTPELDDLGFGAG